MPPIKKRPKKDEEKSASESESDSGPDDVSHFFFCLNFWITLLLTYFVFVQRGPAKKPVESGTNRVNKPGEDPTWELDRMRYVKVRHFKGKIQVDIREYYEKDGKEMPGKRGLSLTVAQWKKLCESMDDINKQLNGWKVPEQNLF